MRRRHQLRPDTFPFLAVLLCTMGSLILVLMVFDRKARLTARTRAEAAWHKNEQDEADRAALLAAEDDERRQARQREQLTHFAAEERRLNIDHDRVCAQLAAVLRSLEAAEQDGFGVKKKQVTDKTAQARQGFLFRQAELTKAARAAEGLRSQRERLTAELLALEAGLRRLREQRQREQQTWSVVPYIGRRGQNVRPHYVECTGEALIFHPDRRTLTGIYLSPESVRDEVRKRTERPARNGPQPYWMLLVRPDGIGNYYVFLSAVKPLDLSYGYEFVDPDWVLDFPDPSKAPLPPTPLATVKPPPRPRVRVGVIVRGASQGQARGSRLPSTSPIAVASAPGGGVPGGPGGSGGVPGAVPSTAVAGSVAGPPGPPGPVGVYGGSVSGSGAPGSGVGGGSPEGGLPGNSYTGGSLPGGGLSVNGGAGGGLPGQGPPGGGSPTGGKQGSGQPGGTGPGSGPRETPETFLTGGSGVDATTGPSSTPMFPGDPTAVSSGYAPGAAPGAGGEGTATGPGTGQGTGPGGGDGTGSGPGALQATGALQAGASGNSHAAAQILPPRSSSLPSLFPAPGGEGQGGTGGATPPGAEGGTAAASSAAGGAGNAGQGRGGAAAAGASQSGAAGAAVGPQDGTGGPPDPLAVGAGAASVQGGVYGPGGTGQQRGAGAAPSEQNPQPPGPLPPDKAVAEGLPRLTAGAAPGGEPAGDGDGMRSPHANGLPSPPPDTSRPRRPRPRALRPASRYGDEEWVLVVDCTARGVRLSPSQLRIPLQELARGHGGDVLLARTVANQIERRRAVQDPAAPPFRPQLRFVVHRDGMRSFHAALPALENIRVPKRTVMVDE